MTTLALVTTAAQVLDEAAARVAGEPEAEAIAVAAGATAYARNALDQGMRS